MTTIAFDGRTLAADRASWKNNYVWNEVSKVFKIRVCDQANERLDLPKHARNGVNLAIEIYYAAAGNAAIVPEIIQWMEKGGARPYQDAGEEKTSCGLVVNANTGMPYYLTGRMTLEPILRWPVAEGGGFEMALGAMLAGADARRAIEITMSRSSWAAAGVDSITLADEVIEKRDRRMGL